MTSRRYAPTVKSGPATRRKQADNGGARRAGRSSGSRTKSATRHSSRMTKLAVIVRPFDELGRRDGCAAVIVVAERAGNAVEHGRAASQVIVSADAGTAARAEKGGRRTAGGRRTIPAKTCGALAAVGHEQRLRLLRKLLQGPATYRSLQKVTKLKAGPLYHHVNQLRLAGLILPKQRDLYELTRGGRNLVLVAMALGSLIRDTRRRPCPSP